jgi:O-antigen/teichoic acid export membrane protein
MQATKTENKQDLKKRTAQGALVSTSAQFAKLVLRMGSLVLLARLLDPKDFGLVGMATAFTGFLSLFKDAGLSTASVQRENVTLAQLSTLFWINMCVGVALALITVLIAPFLAYFYREPRLAWVTVGLAVGFVFGGASAQHQAVLQRGMRFGLLAIIDIISIIFGIVVACLLAITGYGYWALVGMAVVWPACYCAGLWLTSGWIPGLPQVRSGVISMLWFGGTVTINTVIVYIAYNLDKVLIGRFWGTEALGIYGRAYQLINLPTENLNSAISAVAFPALSRVQNDPARLRNYFLKGYSLFLSLVTPITIGCALFSLDIVLVFLGHKWAAAAVPFSLLAPTVVTLALINPFGWLLYATGRARRSLFIALLIAPVVIGGYLIGLPYGANGVASGFSFAMVLLVTPVILWSKRDTMITGQDVVRSLWPVAFSAFAGILVSIFVRPLVQGLEPPLFRLTVESAALFGSYYFSLLVIMNQKAVYASLIRETGLWPLGKWRREGGNDSGRIRKQKFSISVGK